MTIRPWVYCDNLQVYRIEKECFKEPWTQQMICDAFNITLKEFFDYTTERDELSEAVLNLSPKQKQLLISFLKSL